VLAAKQSCEPVLAAKQLCEPADTPRQCLAPHLDVWFYSSTVRRLLESIQRTSKAAVLQAHAGSPERNERILVRELRFCSAIIDCIESCAAAGPAGIEARPWGEAL
jgi:hypothetical protein